MGNEHLASKTKITGGSSSAADDFTSSPMQTFPLDHSSESTTDDERKQGALDDESTKWQQTPTFEYPLSEDWAQAQAALDEGHDFFDIHGIRFLYTEAPSDSKIRTLIAYKLASGNKGQKGTVCPGYAYEEPKKRFAVKQYADSAFLDGAENTLQKMHELGELFTYTKNDCFAVITMPERQGMDMHLMNVTLLAEDRARLINTWVALENPTLSRDPEQAQALQEKQEAKAAEVDRLRQVCQDNKYILAVQLLQTLQILHTANQILHLDVKPDNIMFYVGDDGLPQVTFVDYESIKSYDFVHQYEEKEDVVENRTPGYVSYSDQIDVNADLVAMFMTLYQLGVLDTGVKETDEELYKEYRAIQQLEEKNEEAGRLSRSDKREKVKAFQRRVVANIKKPPNSDTRSDYAKQAQRAIANLFDFDSETNTNRDTTSAVKRLNTALRAAKVAAIMEHHVTEKQIEDIILTVKVKSFWFWKNDTSKLCSLSQYLSDLDKSSADSATTKASNIRAALECGDTKKACEAIAKGRGFFVSSVSHVKGKDLSRAFDAFVEETKPKPKSKP